VTTTTLLRPSEAPDVHDTPRWVLLLLLLVPAAVPVAYIPVLGGPVPLRLMAALALVAVGALAATRASRGLVPLRIRPVTWVLIALVLLSLASSAVARDPQEALRADFLQVTGLLIAVSFGTALTRPEWARRAVGVLLAVGALVCGQAVQGAGSLQASYSGTYVANRAQGLFAQPNDLGSFSALVLVLALVATLSARNGWTRGLCGACLGLSGWALVLSLSRGAILGALLGLVVLPLLLPELRRGYVISLGLGLPVLLFALLHAAPGSTSSVVAERIATIGSGEVSPLDERTAIWAEAGRQILGHPFLGVGPGGYPLAAVNNDERVLTLTPHQGAVGATTALGSDHAHDVLLTTAAEVGVGGAALLVLATVWLGWQARSTARSLTDRRERLLVAGLAAGLSSFVAQGVFDYVLRNQMLLFLVWLVAGLLIGACAGAQQRRSAL
jgi:putative inorganic carbon (hco3(-)) transporter